MGKLNDLAEFNKVVVNPFEFPNREFLLYSIPAFDAGGIPEKCLGKDVLSGKHAMDGDCVLVSKLNPDTPRVWLVQGAEKNIAICSTEFAVLTPKSRVYLHYLYLLCCSPEFASFMESRAVGSTGSRQRVRVSEMLAAPAPIPPEDVARAVRELVDPVHRRLAVARREAQVFASLTKTMFELVTHGARNGTSKVTNEKAEQPGPTEEVEW